MDADDKQKLARALSFAEENNILLKKIRGNMRMANIFKVLYWILIIGAMYAAYHFLMPVLSNLLSVYSGGTSSTGGKSFDPAQIKDLINQIK